MHYPPVPFNTLMVQPPADVRLGAGCLMHYTWGPILSDKTGAKVWKFDKRGRAWQILLATSWDGI